MPPPDGAIPPEEAFELLGHETRLAILYGLWKEHDARGPPPGSTVSFTTLRKHVGMQDGSQFNYHLDKLTGRFIGKTDKGYFLRRPGYRIIQTMLAGTGMKSVSVSRERFDFDCHYCGAETVVVYRDEYLYLACTECVGSLGRTAETVAIPAPDSDTGGLLALFGIDPNWTTANHETDITEVFLREAYLSIQSVLTGLCDSCAGEIVGTLDVCDDHVASSESVCGSCGRRYRVGVEYECTACKELSPLTPGWVLVHHPMTVRFALERGMAIGQPNDPDSLRDTYELAQSADVTVTDDDPREITVDFVIDSDVLRFRLDGEVNVINVDEQALIAGS